MPERAEIIPDEPDPDNAGVGTQYLLCTAVHTPCINVPDIMRGFLFSAVLTALVPGAVQGTEPEGIVDKLDSAVVMTSRAGSSTPVTYSMVSRDELRKTNPINSLPMALGLQPSVVSVNEGGTGLV